MLDFLNVRRTVVQNVYGDWAFDTQEIIFEEFLLNLSSLKPKAHAMMLSAYEDRADVCLRDTESMRAFLNRVRELVKSESVSDELMLEGLDGVLRLTE